MQNSKPNWESAELTMFRDSVRRFIAQEVLPNEPKWQEQKHVDREFWLKAGEAGLLCTDIPAEDGGLGADFRYEVVLSEELGYARSTSWGRAVHNILAQYISRHGTAEQKERYLPRMASGELIGAIAMTEPDAGSDLQSIRSSAIREGDHYVLNGAKTFITNGCIAGLVGVVCKTDPGERARGMSILLVETDGTQGFKVGKQLEKMGMRGQDAAELFFDNVRVPADNLLGNEEGRGFFQLMADLPYERMMIMVRAQAAMESALELTVEHCKDRSVFGEKLIDKQNTRFKLAEVKTAVTIGRVFLDHCITSFAAGELDGTLAAVGKLWLANQQNEVVAECLQLFGGYGYIMEYPIAQAYVDARVQTIYGGSNEVMKELIARTL